MESAAAIQEGGWSTHGHMYTSDEDAEFMSQLLANCSVTNEINEASNSAIQFEIFPSHEYSTMSGIDQGSQYYSTEIANLYLSNGSCAYGVGNNGNYYTSDFHQTMAASHQNTEDLHVWDANSTNLFLVQGEEYGMDHQVPNNVNSEIQSGAPIYERLMQLKRESDHEMTMRAMENKAMVSESSKKRPCSLADVEEKKRNVKSKRAQKAVLTRDVEDHDASPKGQSSSSISSGDDEPSLSPKGFADPNLSCKTKSGRGSAADSQSIYARKRREKINDRLRILQNLVPNGTKVDISTMLEEAVQYVKFLQLQIKLLSSDEMWMYAPIAYNGINIGVDLNS